MHSNFVPSLVLEEGLLIIAFQERISEDNKAYIFHATDAELWYKDLIIFLEWEGTGVKFFEEVYGYLNQGKSVLNISVLHL